MSNSLRPCEGFVLVPYQAHSAVMSASPGRAWGFTGSPSKRSARGTQLLL